MASSITLSVVIPRKIKLSQGKYAIVDEDDFEYLSQWKWYFSNGYARRHKTGSIGGGKIYLHREVAKPADGLLVDHINRDTLDNRKENLRVVEKIINQRNHKLMSHNNSGFNGVSWNKAMKKWEVYIWLRNKKHRVGYFSDLTMAAAERRQAEARLWV